jgi:hypothetical protein
MRKQIENMKGWLFVMGLGAGLFIFIHRTLADSTAWPWKDPAPDRTIGYINPDASSVPIPPIEGDRYEDWVPDTPDAAEMSSLAINVLTCAANPLQDYEQYFSVYIGNPLRMAHNFSDWCTPKFLEAAALLRNVTGSDYMLQADQVRQDSLLKSIGPDGLYYFPTLGKPWYGKEIWWGDGIARADGSLFTAKKPDPEKKKDLDTYAADHADFVIEESRVTQFTHPQPMGRILKVLAIYYLRDGNPMWKRMMETMVERMDQLAIKKGDYAYFPAYMYEPNAKYDPQDPRAAMPMDLTGEEISGRFIRGCALTYRLTGNAKALELAKLLTNYMRYQDNFFGSEGEIPKSGHFHGHTNSVLGMVEYAHVSGDKEMLEFCRKSFEWAKSTASNFGPVTGFTPEQAGNNFPTCEGCGVGDMLALACNLSAFGAGDYYEDAERWFRNYFSEIQLTQPIMNNLVRRGQTMPPKKLLSNETDDHVAQRNLGAFSGWAGGNEWWVGYEKTDNLLMHCCTSNCTRALFFLWNRIVKFNDGQLKVNMLLNRASPWADVYSFIPYQGRVEIKIKLPCSGVLVHAPEWIPTGSSDIKINVDNEPRSFTWEGRYLSLGKVNSNQRIALTCPISEKTVTEKMGRDTYTLLVRGNTVVAIDPPGQLCPLFQREYLRDDNPRWRKVHRFVAAKTIDY